MGAVCTIHQNANACANLFQIKPSRIHNPNVQGLLRIYDYDLGDAEDFDAQVDRLQVALNRDSLAVQVNAQGYRTPMFYAYSSLDEQVPLDATLPLANALYNNYAAEEFVVLDWETAETAPSNRRLGRTQQTLEFFEGLAGPLP